MESKNRVQMKALILFFFLALLTTSQAELYPTALKTFEMPDQRYGQSVEIKVEGSDSLSRIELQFYGTLKPLDSKENYFLSNSKHSIIGFNATEATKSQHLYLIYEASGRVEVKADFGGELAHILEPKYGKMDPDSFILNSIEGNVLAIRYEIYMPKGSLSIQAAIKDDKLVILHVQDIQP